MTRICATTDCGRELHGRNKSGLCRSCASKRANNGWSDEDLALLRRLWPEQGMKCIGQFASRSPSSVQSKATELGIRSLARMTRRSGAERPVNAREDYDRKQQRRYSEHRTRAMQKARAKVAAGFTSSSGRNMVEKVALRNAEELMQAERRQNDPIEAAKLRLQRRGPVYSMAVVGGKPGLFFVHGRRDVSAQDLIELARKAA